MARIEEEMNTRFLDEKQRVMLNIIYTANWAQRKFEDSIKPYGLSPQQFNILRILRGAKDWLPMNEVKKRMIEKSPNATRLADKLVDKEWILRQKCAEDGRMVHLKISDQGLDLLSKIDVENGGPRGEFLDNISKEEAILVSEILDRLRG